MVCCTDRPWGASLEKPVLLKTSEALLWSWQDVIGQPYNSLDNALNTRFNLVSPDSVRSLDKMIVVIPFHLKLFYVFVQKYICTYAFKTVRYLKKYPHTLFFCALCVKWEHWNIPD